MKTWLITGCSSGLGAGIAKAVLRQGDRAAITARNPAALESLVRAYPGQALPLLLDLNDQDSVEWTVQKTVQRFGSVDVLVNNAGHGYRAAIEESNPEAVAEIFQTNFFGPMELTRLVLPQMRERHNGLIVNVTSIGAVRGALGNGYYSAAKGALELASEALAKEVAHLGIRVMVAEPGALRTGFYGERLADSSKTIPDYDVLAERYRKNERTDSRDQSGDPDRAGTVLVETALRPDAPFRLLLGSDAVQAAVEALEERLREARAWSEISCRADFETVSKRQDRV